MTYARKTKLTDILPVADNLREADRMEVAAASGRPPREVLLSCFFEGKPCVTLCNRNDQPVAMCGVVPLEDKWGGIWLLGTDDLVTDKLTRFSFLRQARAFVDELHKQYPVLGNCVDARNKVHVKWLQWMGFTFIAEHPNYGAERRVFLEFVRTCHV